MPRKPLYKQRGWPKQRGQEFIAYWEHQARFHDQDRFGCPVAHLWREKAGGGFLPVCFFNANPGRYTARKRGWRNA